MELKNINLETIAGKLTKNGMETVVVENGEEAKKKVLSMIPEGAEVMVMSSITLIETGIADAIENGPYYPIKDKLKKMDRMKQNLEMQRLGAAPEWAIGSVHGITENGEVIVVSNTGSQLPAYVYGAEHVIWVVGGQKIVKDVDTGMKRIYEDVLPLESKRLSKQYGQELQSNVSKILIVNKEFNSDRIKIILVKDKLGF